MGKKEKVFQEFLQLVTKLEPVEYCGLCKILCVPLFDENKEPRPFDKTIEEVMDKFLGMSRAPRRQLMKVLRTYGGKKNGTST